MIIGKRAGGFDGDEGWELKFNNGAAGSIRWDVETDITGRQRAEGTATGITDGNWHLIGADHTDGAPTGQLQIWYDGAVIATKVANTPGTVDTTTALRIAAADNTPNTNYLTGEIAQVFACNRLLSADEHAWLAKGFSPRFLRPSPCFLLELTSRASPEPDIGRGGLSGVLENAPAVVDNPRIVYPRSADVGQDIWYEFANAAIAGQSALAVTQTRGRTTSATVAGQSALVATISPKVSVAATIAGQSSLTADINPEAPIKATIAAQSTVTATSSQLAGVGTIPIAGQSGLTATLSATVPVSAQVDGQSVITADATALVPVTATVAGQSAVSATGDRIRTLSSSPAAQSATSAAITVEAGAAAQIDGQSALAASLSATVPLDVVVSAQSGVVADISALVPVATTIAGASGITAAATRAQPAEATVAGQSALIVDTRALAPLAATVAAQSSLTATTSATVPIATGIDAESSITARPTYPGVKRTTTVGGVVRWLATVGGRFTR